MAQLLSSAGVGLLPGGGAAADRGDPEIAQAHAVIAAARDRLGGKARVVEHGIEEVAGAIAREGASGAIGAVRAGSKAEDQDAGFGIAKAGNGTTPVRLVAIGTTADLGHLGAPGAEARAALAGNDLLIESFQRGWGRRYGRHGGYLSTQGCYR